MNNELKMNFLSSDCIVEHNGENGRYGLTINGRYMERHEVRALYEELDGFVCMWDWDKKTETKKTKQE